MSQPAPDSVPAPAPTAPPGSSQPAAAGASVGSIGVTVREFLNNAALTTKQSVLGLRQKFEYATAEHKVLNRQFNHSEEVRDRIEKLSWITEQTRTLHQINKDWLKHEKAFSEFEGKHAARLSRAAKTYQPLQLEELLSLWSEGQLDIARSRAEYLRIIENDFTAPNFDFLKHNIKQARLKKKEVNVASLARDNNSKNLAKKREVEEAKPEDKRDVANLRAAEEKLQDSEGQYDLLSGELLMLVDSLEMKQRHELPEALMTLLQAQEVYFQNCIEHITTLKEKIAPLVAELESDNFQPRYRIPEEQAEDAEDEEEEEDEGVEDHNALSDGEVSDPDSK